MIAQHPASMQFASPPGESIPAGRAHIRLSEVIAALSYALDITEGQPEGHAARSCLIGMRLADQINLPYTLRGPLFYALLLKDLGCSSNAARVSTLLGSDDVAARQHIKITDWSHLHQAALFGIRNLAPERPLIERAIQLVKIGREDGAFASNKLVEIRSERGATIARRLGFPEKTAEAIYALDEHWNGHGNPLRLRGEQIPLLARILCIAQTFEIFLSTYGLETAYAMAEKRRRTWFDPALVNALGRLRNDRLFWLDVTGPRVRELVATLAPEEQPITLDDTRLDRIAEGFAQVIDAKSPWTYRHSEGVTRVAVGIAKLLGFDDSALRDLRRAALLHDIGKLGISNSILDKPGALTPAERSEMQRHTIYTQRLLERVTCFRDIAALASAHHERLDGSGYALGLRGEQLSLPARILAVADVYDALAAERPYRPAMQPAQILKILGREAGIGLCARSVDALCVYLAQEGTAK